MAEIDSTRDRSPADTPSDACDTHVHFYHSRFPIAPGALLRPGDAAVADYRAVQNRLGLTRVVVVQPTTYGKDNTRQLEAMATLGTDARGIVVADSTISEEELQHLDALGVRGVRFHMLPGGALPWEELERVAERVKPLGWHIQLQLNGRELTERLEQLRQLPVPLVLDHIGRFMPPVRADHPAFRALLALLDTGHC